MRRLAVALPALLLTAVVGSLPAQAADPQTEAVFRGASTAVQFDVSPPLRSIKPLPIVPGQDRDEFEERETGLEGPLGPQDFDATVQSWVGPNAMPAPIVSFNGPPNVSGVAPPDPNGDVGPNHVVVMSNLSFQVFSKTGTSLFGPALNNTLWAGFGGPCQTENSGDPVVLHDQMADRWILTQFTSAGPTYYNCVAVSTTADPTGSYYRYAFTTGSNFPDYPKYGIWPDALYISTREFAGGSTFAGVGAYAVNRAQLIAGNPAPTVISFLAPPSPAYNVGDGLLPTDMDGNIQPAAGTPNFFIGSMDDGASYGAPQDALTIWKFTADFTTPANSTFALATTLPIAAFDTIPAFCSGRACVPQPGTTNKVDHLGYRQRPLHRAAYRNFGSHQSIVTNQSVEASATMSGIRWWEIRDPNGTPVVFQEGTYAPGTTDGIHRWMGSIAMDTVGNMALGYSASDGTSVFPELRYTGRLAGDPLGTMPQGEGTIVTGTGSQTGGGNRWGDYTSMSVDPVDDCTFWYVNEWVPTTSASGWQLRVGSFKFPSCSLSPTFTLAVTPSTQSVCAPTSATYTANVGSVSGFNSPVTLSATGNPAGTTTGFAPNPVTPLPGSSTLTIGNTVAAAAGSYVVNVAGSAAGPINQNTNVTLNVFTASPAAPTLTAPANGALNQPATPTFTWSAVAQAATYTLEIATDAAFTNIVHTGSNIATTTYNGATLNTNSTYYWRVRPVNVCGTGSNSAAFSFTTQAAPGDCGIGTTPNVLFQDGFEAGAGAWTHSGTGDTWAISTTNPHAGTSHFRGLDPATVSDQRLLSPPVVIPTGQNPVTLSFWHLPNMENSGTTACFDGGILESTTDGGTTFTQVPNANLLVGPYTGAISASFSNPLAGLQGWCNGTAYINTIADVSSLAGQTVQFRFRLGSDTSVSDVGWDVDDVKVQSCQPSGPTCPNVDKGDFNNDSKVDLLFDNLTNNRNMVWFMDGVTRTSMSWISPDAAANQEIVGSDDFNGDGQSDLLLWNNSTGALEFWMMNGATRTGAGVPISGAPTLATNWKLAATGDFNADGKPDLLWRNTTSQKLVIWTMNGTTKTGNIVPTPDQAVDFNWVVAAALDYNNDGARDLLWYNFTSGKIVLWFMNASVVRITGQFTNPANAGDNNWNVYAGGDFGVGSGGTNCTNDIVWRNATSGKEVVWYMDFAGNRTFGVFTIPDSPTSDPDGNPTPATNWIVAGPR